MVMTFRDCASVPALAFDMASTSSVSSLIRKNRKLSYLGAAYIELPVGSYADMCESSPLARLHIIHFRRLSLVNLSTSFRSTSLEQALPTTLHSPTTTMSQQQHASPLQPLHPGHEASSPSFVLAAAAADSGSRLDLAAGHRPSSVGSGRCVSCVSLRGGVQLLHRLGGLSKNAFRWAINSADQRIPNIPLASINLTAAHGPPLSCATTARPSRWQRSPGTSLVHYLLRMPSSPRGIGRVERRVIAQRARTHSRHRKRRAHV